MILTKELLKEHAKNKKNFKKQNICEYTDPEDFILFCYQLSSQAYGTEIEKRFIAKNNMKKISPRLHIGDAIDIDGNNKEIKCSISDSGKFNVVQIRPYQNIFSYFFIFFNIDNNQNVRQHFFEVPKTDITNFQGLSVAHGSKNTNNSDIEYRLSFNSNNNATNTQNGKNWLLLLEKYKIEKKF